MTDRWRRGEQVLHRFRMHGEVIDVRPVTVVADTADELALWLADGTLTIAAALAGGRERRSVPAREIFRHRWDQVEHSWRNHVLMVLPAGAQYAVWHFFAPDGAFRHWYVNLQSPWRRWSGGVDVVDHQLDLVIAPDRTVEWKDEDELTAAVEAGWLTEEDAESAYAAAHRLAKLATDASPPFDDRWTRFRPDPAWPVPPLPPDWRH